MTILAQSAHDVKMYRQYCRREHRRQEAHRRLLDEQLAICGYKSLADAIQVASAAAAAIAAEQAEAEAAVIAFEQSELAAIDAQNAYYDWLAAREEERSWALADAISAGWGHD